MTWIIDVLARMRGLVSVCVKVSERAAAGAIAATRFAMGTFVELLIHLRRLLAISLTALGRTAVRGSEGARVGATRIGYLLVQLRGLLIRLRAPVGISVTASGQAAGRAVEAVRAAAPVIGHAGFAMTRVAYLALQAAARAATEVGRAAMMAGRNSLLSLRAGLSTSATVSRQAAGRLIAASHAGVVRLRGPLAQVRALGSLFVVAPPAHVRPILKTCIGIAGFAILVGALLAAWPRPWRPGPVMAEREVRRQVEVTPVEPATAPSPVQTAAPEAVSSPQRAPVVVSPPDTPRMAARPRPAEARAEIPAPVRRFATSSAPSPSTDAVQSGDAADSTAAIDWLLKGGGSRRRIENP